MTVGEGRQRLDKTLLSHALADKSSVRSIVYSQLLKSPPAADGKDSSNWTDPGKPSIEATDRHTAEVWNLLEELRSASGDDIGKLSELDDSATSASGWKLKEETGRFRVMYRPGSEGTPFHTLCLEGIMEGHIVNSLCVGWEAPLFKEWWPQFAVPTFKIIESKWVRRIRVGEDLALVRFKVPWPFAQREIIFSLFELEYFQEDLVFVLMHSVPTAVETDEKAYGFCSADLPQTPHYAVRMDLAGGFAMQKMASGLSYFRSIMNLDMKLDFVPPWIINFMSRQLAGQGYKLFQKAVLQVESGKDGKSRFQQLVKTEPLYARIREGLDMAEKFEFGSLPPVTGKFAALKETARDKGKTLQGSLRRLGSAENYRVAPYPHVQALEEEAVSGTVDASSVPPLPPVDLEAIEPALEAAAILPANPSSTVSSVLQDESKISSVSAGQEATDPEVKWALEVLDKMIAYVKEHGPDALPFLQPEGKECDLERSKEVSNHDLAPSEPPEIPTTNGPQVLTLRKEAEDVAKERSALKSRSLSEKPVIKNSSQASRPGYVRKGGTGSHEHRRWSVFNCLPTSRLTKKQPLRIEKPPAPGSSSTVPGEPVGKIGGKALERSHLPPSNTIEESNTIEDVSLGELISREAHRT